MINDVTKGWMLCIEREFLRWGKQRTTQTFEAKFASDVGFALNYTFITLRSEFDKRLFVTMAIRMNSHIYHIHLFMLSSHTKYVA